MPYIRGSGSDSPLTLLLEALKSFSFVNLDSDCGMGPVRALLARDSTSSACALESWVGVVEGGQGNENSACAFLSETPACSMPSTFSMIV